MVELTERVSITAEAVELGWVMNQISSDATVFAYSGRWLAVQWTADGEARRAQLSCEGGTVIIADREYTGDGASIGPWVRDTLRTWLIQFQSEVGA
ncbi:hypothetical protein AB0H76_15075 [Nocardia sp. NPDC050712]|uniref:hypothetical protein n=1 Tax=Nocardia sp. NPDC050712 TaxID=3155518 RepID=UPI0033EAD00E